MKADSNPPVTWPLFQRLRYFGGTAVACAVLVIAVELFFADVPSGRAFNKFSPTGSSPLWETVHLIAVWVTAGGLLIALLLPLYKRRYGGALVGLAVFLILPAYAAVSGGEGSRGGGRIERWQHLVLFVGFGIVAMILGHQARPLALGEDAEESGDVPHVT